MDKWSDKCILLKFITNYKPNINEFASSIQQQKLHLVN